MAAVNCYIQSGVIYWRGLSTVTTDLVHILRRDVITPGGNELLCQMLGHTVKTGIVSYVACQAFHKILCHVRHCYRIWSSFIYTLLTLLKQWQFVDVRAVKCSISSGVMSTTASILSSGNCDVLQQSCCHIYNRQHPSVWRQPIIAKNSVVTSSVVLSAKTGSGGRNSRAWVLHLGDRGSEPMVESNQRIKLILITS